VHLCVGLFGVSLYVLDLSHATTQQHDDKYSPACGEQNVASMSITTDSFDRQDKCHDNANPEEDKPQHLSDPEDAQRELRISHHDLSRQHFIMFIHFSEPNVVVTLRLPRFCAARDSVHQFVLLSICSVQFPNPSGCQENKWEQRNHIQCDRQDTVMKWQPHCNRHEKTESGNALFMQVADIPDALCLDCDNRKNKGCSEES
jgi:hypothetical protein